MEEAERHALYRAFYEEASCCLDSWFSQWLRASLSSPSDLDSAEHQLLLATLAEHSPLTNMPLEGLLAQIRQSAPYAKAKPSLEKLAGLGLLTQLKKDQTHENPDFLRETRKDMVQADVPLQAVRSSSSVSRWDNRWRNARHHRPAHDRLIACFAQICLPIIL